MQEGNSVRPDGESIRFDMNNLSEEDTLADARKSIEMALMLAHSADIGGQYFKDTSLQMFLDVIGSRDFQVLTSVAANESEAINPPQTYEWRLLANDYHRFSNLGLNERYNNAGIMLKLESPTEGRMIEGQTQREKASTYDCLAIFRHADQSNDWLPCKIVSRRLRAELANLRNVSFNAQCFDYEVSFLHLE